MTVLIMLACFLALPVGIWIGYRAGYSSAMCDVDDRQQAFAAEMREHWGNNSQLLRARPALSRQVH